MTPAQRFAMLVLWAGLGFGPVSTSVGFEPPKRHPVSRYEPDWQKNPFTLKTAPIALQKEPWARDLALGGIDNLGDGNRVILVNTKTQQRFPIKEGETSPAGMKITSVHRAISIKDSYVEVELAGEAVKLGYDETYLKRVAVTPSGPGAASQKVAAAASPSDATSTSSPSRKSSDLTGTARAFSPASPALASQDAPVTSVATGRSEMPASRQRRRVQTVPNTP